MNAGRLRHRITLQALTRTTDDFGGVSEAWADAATLWASVEPLKGDEYFSATSTKAMPQAVASVDARLWIRPRSGINPALHRVVHNGITYDIVSVIGDNWGRNMQLMVKAKATEQTSGSGVNG
ncbi:phage head closure protein [Desulfovibrio desulfuricans]|uniref:phage head closure protein n=1 Tax=Desulfovibrio desulfuricans TaxID=876 RepID=UPI001D07DB2E|nr:phage head closure protein [Desulfovibrio desulfuricans]MCB6541139.1 phage head closure protein [Desulfovibrio desulfuricans]MCB6552221.1 phage head closure protein [Desulfovibrio desulfuricans]MCB6564064.1 phage head closure protein [Desulfovibrio desulfuricans]MCB7345244.1 phage head closure protein [Desulfovibrio desulfuricans]MCQ5217303.1 phage head closure protein [Desulfovibrio desulfuricans]